MAKFLLWCILLVLCWPLALVALVLYPLVWLLLLPFRFVGIVVTGVLELIRRLIMLPARVLQALAAPKARLRPLLLLGVVRPMGFSAAARRTVFFGYR
ncbi:MAG TPA: hypothetical protein VHM88_24400 [Candidatus Acidoferrales bacterium]|nr:hypothetical protein [Candidatus Acidoferrales bacterium]